MMNFFLLGLSFLLLHEMDAIRCREWRIFPGLSVLDDQKGFVIFMLLHIPLFYWVLFALQQQHAGYRTGFDLFMIAHFFAHVLFLLHKKNEFKDWLSWAIISGAGLFGLLDLILL